VGSQDHSSLGIDLGSVTIKGVVLDARRRPLLGRCLRTRGRPLQTARRLLAEMTEQLPELVLDAGVVTGSGKTLLAGPLGFGPRNEIVAHAEAAWTAHPEVRSIIEIGGQDSKYIRVGRSDNGRPYIEDHAFNELCAAGTGAFLDQQAGRLDLSVQRLGDMAAEAPRAAPMAGRCAVFAKSDMIHLQQRGCPPDEIAAGLCFALARNYLAALCRGVPPVAPVLLQGGVAANRGVLRAFRELLGLSEQELIRPEGHQLMGATGAALLAAPEPLEQPVALEELARRLQNVEAAEPAEDHSPPLTPPPEYPRAGPPRFFRRTPAGVSPAVRGRARRSTPVRAFVGVDVGSVSTKAAAVDAEANLLASSYVRTAGDPLGAVARVMREVLGEGERTSKEPGKAARAGRRLEVAAVVTTGSGRHLARELLLAREAQDEISAQARSAAHYLPETDTVIEIGGQDSKYIRLDGPRVARFQMNRACAAGTGSFLEEQCGRLGIDIDEQFADLALSSERPATLGSRCTVFMDSDLVHHLQRGGETADLCAGLAHATARNYLEKVAGSRPMGQKVLLSGGVAKNRAVHAVFAEILDAEVRVHPYPELSGALGAALRAREVAEGAQEHEHEHEHGHGLVHEEAPRTRTFQCRACENLCEVHKITFGGGRVAHFGSVCDRFEVGSEEPVAATDAFTLRQQLLEQVLREHAPKEARSGGDVVGLPLSLSMLDHLPFWSTFLSHLGFDVELSGPTSREMVRQGVARVPAEFCHPVKVLFGHVLHLLDRGVKQIFIPHLRMLVPPGEEEPRYACPYTQSAPYVVRANVPEAEVLSLEYPVPGEQRHWLQGAADALGKDRPAVRKAMAAGATAQQAFVDACRQEGERYLEQLSRDGKPGAVLLGRPYNTADRQVNLNLARRLQRLGIAAVPYDFLPLEREELPFFWFRVRWGYGRQALQAARLLKKAPNLSAVIVTNFGCGPDAFVDQYLEYELSDTPHIVLELDDHQAEAGLVTRLEAFARSLGQYPAERTVKATAPDPGRSFRHLRQLTYYIPHFSDHARAYTGALRASGCEAVLLPPTDDESWRLGLAHAHGRECHPFISFCGDLLKAARRPDFVPERACYYGPSYFGPCLVPQYMLMLHLISRRIGLGEVTVMNIADPSTMEELGRPYVMRLALGLYAMDRMFKWKVETEPYEVIEGEVRRVHQQNMEALEEALAGGGFFKELAKSIARFEAIELTDDAGTRPRVGIIGDVYTRVNEHANDQLYRRLQEMGFEVWSCSSLIDVSFLGSEQLHAELKRRGRTVAGGAAKLLIPLIRTMRHRVDRLFPDTIRTPQERQFEHVHRAASRHASHWIDKALSLSISRVEELRDAGADGVLNVMCHNCMIGTVAAALFPSLRRDTDLPLCNLVYEGLQSTQNENRLEAFAEQVMNREQGTGNSE